jgi:hypothetical protein
VPTPVIDARIKERVICPNCNTPRSLRLLRTKDIGYDAETKEFYLICDHPTCGSHARMVTKEGDSLGIEPIRDRLELDEKIMRQLRELTGVPKILLRNTIPVDQADATADGYEITPAYRYEWNEGAGAVNVIEEPWTIKDEEGVLSYSLLPAPVVVSFIKRLVTTLGL